MKRVTSYAREVREWLVRIVAEHLGDYPSRWATIQSVAQKLGMAAKLLHLGQAIRGRSASSTGLTTHERTCVHKLERENSELDWAGVEPKEHPPR